MPVVVIIKRKPKKISRSSFTCWELSRVNSFISFLFFGGREEKTTMKMLTGSHMHYCWFNKSPYYLVFSFVSDACRFHLSPMHVHYYYYYSHRSVVQVKGNNDDIWWTYWDEKSWYELNLSRFCKYDDSSFLIHLLWIKHICNDI